MIAPPPPPPSCLTLLSFSVGYIYVMLTLAVEPTAMCHAFRCVNQALPHCVNLSWAFYICGQIQILMQPLHVHQHLRVAREVYAV